MFTATQTLTAQSIVNLFETGAVLGDYGNVTVIPDDTGHLTFGRPQTTLGSGNLLDLLNRYSSNPRARFGKRPAPWLPRFEEARGQALHFATSNWLGSNCFSTKEIISLVLRPIPSWWTKYLATQTNVPRWPRNGDNSKDKSIEREELHRSVYAWQFV
jgi:hypothetical protein